MGCLHSLKVSPLKFNHDCGYCLMRSPILSMAGLYPYKLSSVQSEFAPLS